LNNIGRTTLYAIFVEQLKENRMNVKTSNATVQRCAA